MPANLARQEPALQERSEPSVEDLIRLLLGVAEELPERSPEPGGESEQILLDLDVDGARYLLVRLPLAERPLVQLSPREKEIVRMIAQGHPNKVIAQVLGISTYTVCTHLRRVFAKVGVGSRAAMIARLFEKRNAMPEKVQSVAGPIARKPVASSYR